MAFVRVSVRQGCSVLLCPPCSEMGKKRERVGTLRKMETGKVGVGD